MDAPADLKERLKASYDAMAEEYNEWTTKRHTSLRLKYLDELLARVPKLTATGDGEDKKSAVLELGCGSGKPFLETLLSKAPNVTATANDLSDTQLNLARENLSTHAGRVNFVQGDMAALSFTDSSLTAVVALYSLIHLTSAEQEAMLSKIASWLEPGGVLLACFGTEEGSGVFEHWLHDKGWMYWAGLGKEGTNNKLAEVGFKVEKGEIEGDSEEKFLWVIARK